jgi:hypothetical protein
VSLSVEGVGLKWVASLTAAVVIPYAICHLIVHTRNPPHVSLPATQLAELLLPTTEALYASCLQLLGRHVGQLLGEAPGVLRGLLSLPLLVRRGGMGAGVLFWDALRRGFNVRRREATHKGQVTGKADLGVPVLQAAPNSRPHSRPPFRLAEPTNSHNTLVKLLLCDCSGFD